MQNVAGVCDYRMCVKVFPRVCGNRKAFTLQFIAQHTQPYISRVNSGWEGIDKLILSTQILFYLREFSVPCGSRS